MAIASTKLNVLGVKLQVNEVEEANFDVNFKIYLLIGKTNFEQKCYHQLMAAPSVMRSKENIEHEVTDCTFCDCKVKWSVSSAEFLSNLENITVEETEDVKEIEIDRTYPWVDPLNSYTIPQTKIQFFRNY